MKKISGFIDYRALIIAVIAAGDFFSARAGIPVSGLLQDLTTRIEEIATAPVLQSNDNYVLEEYLNGMLIQNPEMREFARVQPDGSILKAVAGNGYSVPSQNVASESWFNTVYLTRQPFNTLLRDKQGTDVLFRAWPILGPGAGKKVTGITYVKINLTKFIQSVSEDANEPLEVLYNSTPVFRRKWTGIHAFREDSFAFSNSDKFVVRYADPEVPKSASAAPRTGGGQPQESLSVQRDTEQEKSAATAMLDNEGQTTGLSVPETAAVEPAREETTVIPSSAQKKAAGTSNAKSFLSLLSTDSMPPSEYTGFPKKQATLVIILFAGLGFAMIFIIAIIMVRRARRRRSKGNVREAMFKPDPVPTVKAGKDAKLMNKEDARPVDKIPVVRPGYSPEQVDGISHAERETRVLPPLREFIDDFLRKIHEINLESDINQRNRVFEELNDDLNIWARSEVKQLSGRLGLLLQAIRECESKDGNSAELQVLRYEVMRIIKEVDKVEEHLPKRIPF